MYSGAEFECRGWKVLYSEQKLNNGKQNTAIQATE